nr:hypothetical protein [Cellvibrionaceae bacterium]
MKSPFSLFRKNKAPATQREDKAKNFLVKRIKSRHGFYVFVLENLVEKRRIYIPHFVFGRFRACLRRLLQKELALSSPRAFERRIGFLNKDYFYFKSSQMDLQNLIIQDLDEPEGSSGYITVNRRDAKLLSEVLYSEALQHPSDVLSSIVSYHKLFQFSFVKTSKSITSDLILRKDILQEISDYKPSLAARSPEKPKPLTEAEQQRRSHAAHFAKSHSPLTKANYQPRLGERFHEKEIKVDYGQLFSGAKARPDNTENEKSKKKADNTSPLMQFATTLSASEVKNFGEGKFRLSLGSDEANEFRNRFICDRFSEFYLGFEIVDTLFLQRKVLKTLRFPLYYLKISVRESGREVRLQAKDDGKIYLNHLALAHVINKFGTSKTEMEGLSEFFNTLLVQQLNIDQVSDRICLCRHLPLADSIFDRTREILFGFQGENGKGGILGNLNFKGIECDLNSVILYRAASLLSPLEQALEVDVDDISGIAHHSVDRFYASLLGKFLTPELAVAEPAKQNAGKPVWIPGRLPKSTQQLIEKLSYHEIVLLEGPPGT